MATTMEILGFAEVFLDVFPHFRPTDGSFDRQIVGLSVLAFLYIFICIGMRLVFLFHFKLHYSPSLLLFLYP